ncbi:MFS transporter [Pantoea sp. SIMBA_072]
MLKSSAAVRFTGIMYSGVRMLIGAYSVIYMLQNGLSVSQVGLLKTFQGIIIVFLDIPLSYFSDRYSRKFSISVSILFSSAWLLTMAVADNFWFFMLAELFNALSLGMMSGTFDSYLYDHSKNENNNISSQKIFSLYYKYQFMFMGVTSLIGATAYFYIGKSSIFISSLLMFIIFLMSAFLPSDRQFKSEEKSNFFTFTMLCNGIRQVFVGRTGLLTLLTVIISSFFLQSLIQYWQVIAGQDLPEDGQAIILGIVFFLIMLTQSATGFVTENLPSSSNARFHFIFFLLVIISSVSSLYFNNIYMSAFFLCIIFFYINFVQIISYARMVSHTESSLRSVTLSTIATVNKIVMFVMIAPFGFLLQTYDWLFIIPAFLIITPLFFLYFRSGR